MKFKAIIFDMDGVLIDSQSYWDTMDRNFFQSRGLAYTDEVRNLLMGKSMKENVSWIKETYARPETEAELTDERTTMTDKIYTDHASILPGVQEIIQMGKASGHKQAIASGSALYRIEHVVNRFGWQSYFDALVSTDHVGGVGKPAPDIYLKAVEMLGLEPADCVAIEDAENGVRAAKAAGLACIAVPNRAWGVADFSMADIEAESLMDTQVFDFIGL